MCTCPFEQRGFSRAGGRFSQPAGNSKYTPLTHGVKCDKHCFCWREVTCATTHCHGYTTQNSHEKSLRQTISVTARCNALPLHIMCDVAARFNVLCMNSISSSQSLHALLAFLSRPLFVRARSTNRRLCFCQRMCLKGFLSTMIEIFSIDTRQAGRRGRVIFSTCVDAVVDSGIECAFEWMRTSHRLIDSARIVVALLRHNGTRRN